MAEPTCSNCGAVIQGAPFDGDPVRPRHCWSCGAIYDPVSADDSRHVAPYGVPHLTAGLHGRTLVPVEPLYRDEDQDAADMAAFVQGLGWLIVGGGAVLIALALAILLG